jgi:hypothetical protein
MRPNGVWAILGAAVTLSLIPLASADGAVAPPKCWKGKAGCTHTATPHWNVRTSTGTVEVVGTRQQLLTCSDTSSGSREEIVAGRYTVKVALDAKASQTRIGADAHKNPATSNPLKLVFDVTSTTHERVRTLTPAGDGACTESFRDCDKTNASRRTDTLDVFLRANRIVQETPGDFIKSAFLECAETPAMASLLPDDPVDGTFMSEQSRLSAFRHRDTVVTFGRDHQIGDGNTSINLSGKVTYGRSIRACTRYPLAKPRCRTARG